MKEFMLLIRNTPENPGKDAPGKHEDFLRSCEQYIKNLQAENRLISAQPMIREGVMLSGTEDNWQTKHYREGNDVMVGYYHIRAHDMDDAIEIAKKNPEFAFTSTARIEVRPLKTKEVQTGYQYPGKE